MLLPASQVVSQSIRLATKLLVVEDEQDALILHTQIYRYLQSKVRLCLGKHGFSGYAINIQF
jgi:hypothetical protein